MRTKFRILKISISGDVLLLFSGLCNFFWLDRVHPRNRNFQNYVSIMLLIILKFVYVTMTRRMVGKLQPSSHRLSSLLFLSVKISSKILDIFRVISFKMLQSFNKKKWKSQWVERVYWKIIALLKGATFPAFCNDKHNVI